MPQVIFLEATDIIKPLIPIVPGPYFNSLNHNMWRNDLDLKIIYIYTKKESGNLCTQGTRWKMSLWVWGLSVVKWVQMDGVNDLTVQNAAGINVSLDSFLGIRQYFPFKLVFQLVVGFLLVWSLLYDRQNLFLRASLRSQRSTKLQTTKWKMNCWSSTWT